MSIKNVLESELKESLESEGILVYLALTWPPNLVIVSAVVYLIV